LTGTGGAGGMIGLASVSMGPPKATLRTVGLGPRGSKHQPSAQGGQAAFTPAAARAMALAPGRS